MSMLPIGLPPIGAVGATPIGFIGGIVFIVDGMEFKKLLKPPLLSAVVVKLTCGGCGAIGGDPIFPPRGPLAMQYLQKKLVFQKIIYD
jgi:hypothetical protein